MLTTEPTPVAVVDGLAARVAAWGVPGSNPGGPIEVPDRAWPALLSRLRTERISGLAVAAAAAGALRVPGDRWDALVSQHREAMAWCLAVERTLLRVARWLEDAGVPFVVLKGLALAHTLYPDPSWRAFGDVDLLVHARDWRRVCAVLQAKGYARELPEPRKGFDERFGKAAVFVSEDGVQIDLHRTLVLGPFGLWLDPEKLFERTATVVIGGHSMSRLQDTELLLHACMHAALGANPPLLVPLRDVLQVAGVGQVDWAHFQSLAASGNLRVVTRHALRVASRTLRADPPSVAGDVLTYRPTPRELRLLGAYTAERSGRGALAISALAAVKGINAKVAYARALLVPSREFLTARAGRPGMASYLHRWGTAVRWARIGRRGRHQ